MGAGTVRPTRRSQGLSEWECFSPCSAHFPRAEIWQMQKINSFLGVISFWKKLKSHFKCNLVLFFFSQNTQQKQHLDQVLFHLYLLLALCIDNAQMIEHQWGLDIQGFILVRQSMLGMAKIIYNGWPNPSEPKKMKAWLMHFGEKVEGMRKAW